MTDTGIDRVFGTFDPGADGGINPPISDSSTYVFDSAGQMYRMIEGDEDGRFIYARHLTPSTIRLARAMAALEGTEGALVTSSGMGAISSLLLSLVSSGDEIVAARTVYGGTYALLANFLPRFGVRTTFVDLDDPLELQRALTARTRILYCESLSNPLLQVADLPALSMLARSHGIRLVVDNTFTPLSITPHAHGADAVVLSLTKYVNGMADGLAGSVCGSSELVERLLDLEQGASLVLGVTLDSHRAASIAKNAATLHLRVRRHADNALAVAEALEAAGLVVHYPGLASHPQHERFKELSTGSWGFGGILSVDLETARRAEEFVTRLRASGAALVAVSLGCPRTVVTVPHTSTAAEIPEAEQRAMGLGPGLVRIATGLEPSSKRLTESFIEAAVGAVATVG